jgi:large subunit ribosomal protein L10
MAKRTKQAVKHTGRERKEQIVAELVEKLNGTQGVVFADYKGLTHKQLEDLKRELKKMDATIVIAKNSLVKISLGKIEKYSAHKDNENLNLPTATLLINGDYVEPLKRLQKAIKEYGLPKVKFGIIDGQALDESGVLKIASLPNRETLIAQLVGVLNSPIQGLVVTLNAPIQKLAMVLNAIAQNKPASPAPTEPSQPTADTTKAPAEEAQTSEATVEEASPAAEPAQQPDAPIATDEIADAGTETPSEPAEQAEETKTEENTEGGEDK